MDGGSQVSLNLITSKANNKSLRLKSLYSMHIDLFTNRTFNELPKASFRYGKPKSSISEKVDTRTVCYNIEYTWFNKYFYLFVLPVFL